MIKCEHLTHYYGKRLIYEDLNFEVPEGRILGLLGKNGTGKTTTINILNGFLQPKEGRCSIMGKEISTLNSGERAQVGLLLEGHVQYPFFNVQQIEKYYSRFFQNWDRAAYYELVNKLEINPKQTLSTMSCGQKSQVALGLLLAQNPKILILDDFSMGLDPGYRRLFIEYMRDFAQSTGKTLFLTSHIIQDMERLIDDVMIMDYGRLMVQQPLGELLDTFNHYRIDCQQTITSKDTSDFHQAEVKEGVLDFGSFLSKEAVVQQVSQLGLDSNTLHQSNYTLEDAFIQLTGKY